MRFRVALVLTAAALAYWATADTRSFLYAFLVTLFLCAVAVGLGLMLHALGAPAPTRTDTEIERRIEFEEYLAALDRATDWGES